MRRSVLMMAIALVLLLASSPVRASGRISGSEVKIFAAKGIYEQADGKLKIYSYEVKVVIKNLKKRPLEFENAQGTFQPMSSKPLVLKTYRKKRSEHFTLKGSGLLEFYFTTDGFTIRLMADCVSNPLSSDYPLLFKFAIISGDKVVDGTYFARLPDMEALAVLRKKEDWIELKAAKVE
jgi:hypothetical protein